MRAHGPLSPGVLLAVALGVLLAAVSLHSGSGQTLSSAVTVEIVLQLLGGAAIALAVLACPVDRRLPGAVVNGARLAEGRDEVAPHPGVLGALPGEEKRESGHGYHLTRAAPHVRPAPNAVKRIRSPRLTRPSRDASSRAIGIDAALVFP